MKTEVSAQIREDTNQIRAEIGEHLGSCQPQVQLALNRALDALERIDRAVEHGVGPGEAPPVQRPGVLPDGLNRDDATRQNRGATTAEVRRQTRHGDTDVKPSRGEASAEAREATAKAVATKSVAGAEDRPKEQAGKK